MKLHSLKVYINLLNRKIGSTYYLRVNSKLKKFIKKLELLNHIKDLEYKGNLLKFSSFNIQRLDPLREISLNFKNLSKLKNSLLKNNKYYELLVSTSKGLYTHQQCELEKIGGVVLARILKKNEA